MRVKRRRIDWECHLKKDDPVIFHSNGYQWIGKVVATKLRQFGDSYNRVVVLVEPNFVSNGNFSHIYNRSAQYDQFYLTTIATDDGKITTEPHANDRVIKLDADTPVYKWRDNIEKYQEVWFRSAYEKRRRLRCVVVDVQEDTISIQPKFSKLIKEVKKYSQQIEPLIRYHTTYQRYELRYQRDYIIHTAMCTSMDRKCQYLGAWCEIKSRQSVEFGNKSGFIIDVDYGVDDGKNLYCYVEDSGASEFIPHHRFDSHMTYVEWVPEEEITILGLPKNKISQRSDVELENNVLKVKYLHCFSQTDVQNLLKLAGNDLELMFYYILKHAKANSNNDVLYGIAYQLWSHHSYLIRPLYSPFKDSYEMDGLKTILLAKQDYFLKTNNMVQLLQVQQRIQALLTQPGMRQHMSQILEAEESYRNIPIFKFTPLRITKCEEDYFMLDIKVSLNNVHTLDVVAYSGTSIGYNTTALRPMMCRLLDQHMTTNVPVDIYKMSMYAKENVYAFKNDTSTYTRLNQIATLKKYQSWIVSRMVEEEEATEPLSDIYTSKISDDLQYNFIAGFQAYDRNVSRGGILCLNVGWGKTIIILELLLRRGGSTLICAPLTLIDQWKSEIQKFTPSLSVCEYYGRKKEQDADVVFTTYSTLRTVVGELKTFHRVVFDESHMIKNPHTQRAAACFNVNAKSRWCVTATPYNDNNAQFQTQLRMLQIKPFEMNVNMLHNDSIYYGMFKRILFSLCPKKMRRLGIQPIEKKVKKTKVISIEPDEDLVKLLNEIRVNLNKQDRSWSLSALKPAILRTQIACTDPSVFSMSAFSCRSVNENQEVTKEQLVQSLHNRTNVSEEYKKSFIQKLHEENTGTCCICLCEYEEPTITPCLHIYCNRCIKESLKRNTKCPQCRQQITAGQLKKMVTTHVEDKSVDNTFYFTDILGDSWTIPSDVREAFQKMQNKIPKKFEYIKNLLTETDKACVIFSQYSLPLERLKQYLDSENIDSGLISGKTSRKKRAKMIQEFGEGTLKTFLLSTKTASVGINLQKGSTIVFLEPIIALADQIQSIGRLYRIGQEEDIDVIQLETKGTYEENMSTVLREFKEEQRQINRRFRGREKKVKQSHLKHKIYRHILT